MKREVLKRNAILSGTVEKIFHPSPESLICSIYRKPINLPKKDRIDFQINLERNRRSSSSLASTFKPFCTQPQANL